MSSETQADLAIKLFGPFDARRRGSLLSGLQNREGERLLAILTLQSGRILPSTTLAAQLWPETGSLDSLRQSVAHLRQALGEEGIRLQLPKGGVLLNLDGADVDLIAFDRAAAGGDIRCSDK